MGGNTETRHAKQRVKSRRTFLLWGGILALFYPVLQFVGYALPKKPIFVKITNPIPASGFLVTREFILFDKNERCWALSRKCTHLGCKLNYLEEKNILECPCHQSQFHPETGVVLKGPAKKQLSFFPVEKRDSDPLYVVQT